MNECFCTCSAVLMVRFGIFRLSYFPLILPPFLGIAGYAVLSGFILISVKGLVLCDADLSLTVI